MSLFLILAQLAAA